MKLPDWVRGNLSEEKDERLKQWVERGRALREIKDSKGFGLILSFLTSERDATIRALQTANVFTFSDLQAYNRAINALLSFIQTAEKYAEGSSAVLSEREEAARAATSLDEYHRKVFGE